ncbi:MAG TPA: hypothetical protein VKB02_15110 [Pyrinomonadaceae bacterium]|nr:hypothetical protein [Pyrinomonadaceae bacterium]
MKLLLLTGLLLLIPFQQTPQTVDREQADLAVLKFSWSKYRQNTGLMSSVTDPGPPLNEPVSLKAPERRNETSESRSRRDIQERRAALANADRNGTSSGAPPRQDYYMMRLEVKNVGQNTTKSIVWEFQPAVQTPDYETKQYVCKIKTKPNESKSFELMSPAAPVKVVSADQKAQEGKVVINRIEYADGTVWKRKGWSVLIPAEMTDQIANGKCVMF